MSLITIRAMRPEDRRFIEASFFESYLKTLRLPTLPFEVFKHGMNVRIERLLRDNVTLVAVATSHPDEILGYVICHPKVTDKQGLPVCEGEIHYLYVKAPFRRQGIGKALLALGPFKCYTHMPTPDGAKFFRALGVEFNPALGEPEDMKPSQKASKK